MTAIDWELYRGTGAKRTAPIPPAVNLDELVKPEGYLADEGLRAAVNVALALGQPLLITGDPGTGKTQLAYSVGYELGLEVFRFDTKTTSAARDLFYRYDALRHFQAANTRSGNDNVAKSALQYIDFEALGRAILLAMRPEQANAYLPPELRNTGPRRSLVLVDEIDKAPRDLPNDLLNEVEEMRFTIRETGDSIPPVGEKVDHSFRPVLILTSNSEKNLPDAFLRRCVYFHVPVPDPARLEKIVAGRLGIAPLADKREPATRNGPATAAPAASPRPASAPSSDARSVILRNAVDHFVRLREIGLKKKPATAELIAWVRMLIEKEVDLGQALTPEKKKVLGVSYSILAKTREDLDTMMASSSPTR
jgi:MoxR-like ATPase